MTNFPDARVPGEPWYDQLRGAFNSGDVVMEVHALTAPEGLEDSRLVKIADLVLMSDLYTSDGGDERLMF